MSDGPERVYRAIDQQHADKSASTRRQMIAGTAATLGGLGLLGLPGVARAQSGNDPQRILNVAATAEVLATIVNTIGHEKRLGLDSTTRRNIRAAAREELIHYQVLTSSSVGGRAITKRIWVPDEVFRSRRNFLNTLEVGDQIFINAYLIGTKAFGDAGNGQLAAVAAEFMGAEAVHRALARQSLRRLGNDRVFMKADDVERAPGAPTFGAAGFSDIDQAVAQLQFIGGFGFGAQGKKPGRFYEFDEVSRRTPDDPDVNQRTPDFIGA